MHEGRITEDELQRLLKVARVRPLERAKLKRTRKGVTPEQRVKLLRLGAAPRTAQALARHSKLELTMRTYTDVRLLDLRSAVESAAPEKPAQGTCVKTHTA